MHCWCCKLQVARSTKRQRAIKKIQLIKKKNYCLKLIMGLGEEGKVKWVCTRTNIQKVNEQTQPKERKKERERESKRMNRRN